MAKTPLFSDIDLENWKDYEHLITDSLWTFNRRAKGHGHKLDYHGNYIPQLAAQLIERYSKRGEVVVEPFMGMGTGAIEALRMSRQYIGVDIRRDVALAVDERLISLEFPQDRYALFVGDSTSPATWRGYIDTAARDLTRDRGGIEPIGLTIMHPPYLDAIQFSKRPEDLSNMDLVDFQISLKRVARLALQSTPEGRFCALIIGDLYKEGELIPLMSYCLQLFTDAGWSIKAINVKNIEGNERGNGRQAGLWRYRALANGFSVFKHEYVVVFQNRGD